MHRAVAERARPRPVRAAVATAFVPGRSALIGGARWRGLLQFGQQGLSIVATMVLARLLFPADFGIVAAATSLVVFFQLGTTWGFEVAVVRREHVDDHLLRGLFTASLLNSLPLVAAGCLLAPVIAGLLDRPDATLAVVCLMPTVLLNAVNAVPSGLLQREMRFRAAAMVPLVSTVIYVVLEILLAVAGLGYWAVVIGLLVSAVVQTIGFFVASRWPIRLGDPRQALREEGSFSSLYFVAGVLFFGTRNLDYWIVGATLGATALGSYYVAFVLPTILRLRLSGVTHAILVPLYSRLRDDRERLRRAYTAVTELQIAVVFPMMAGTAILAAPIVTTFFGHQWTEAAGPLRWIALAAALDTLTLAHNPAALAEGLVGRNLTVLAAQLTALGAGVWLAASRTGDLTAVAAAVALASAVALVTSQAVVARKLGLHIGLVAAPVGRILVATVAMAAVVIPVAAVLEGAGLPAFAQLAICAPLGVAAYLGAGLLIAPGAFRRYLADGRQLVHPTSSRAA
jgi:PST family polysaccharide transporter